MDHSSLTEIEITADMVLNARSEQSWLDTHKQGAKTRNVYQDKNIVGSLAHQCVEVAFENYGVAFTSYRTQRYSAGDVCDIAYEDDRIDVKGTHAAFNQKYFYNRQFLVFADQLEDQKINAITHFCFVEIEPDYSRGRIYGIIRVSEFLRNAQTVILKYKNKGIKAYQLKPFAEYILRV